MIDTTTSQGSAEGDLDPSSSGAPDPHVAATEVVATEAVATETVATESATAHDGDQVGDGAASADATVDTSGSDPDSHRFECRSCGYVYDPSEGIRKLAIEAGTPFSALDPLSFRCPVCRSKTLAFRDIGPRDKPSGFEENLNFGLGVNRLTPGQKNVLIFGGFALAIAFFLSLYSLR